MAQTPADPMRRRQGDFFLFAGVMHLLLMVFASLYASGRFPRLFIDVHRWNNLYFSYFLYVYVGSVFLIIGQCRKTEVFLPQAILDFIFGVGVFQILFWVLRSMLFHLRITPWLSLLPGLFLTYYGFQLHRGRTVWKRLDLD